MGGRARHLGHGSEGVAAGGVVHGEVAERFIFECHFHDLGFDQQLCTGDVQTAENFKVGVDLFVRSIENEHIFFFDLFDEDGSDHNAVQSLVEPLRFAEAGTENEDGTVIFTLDDPVISGQKFGGLYRHGGESRIGGKHFRKGTQYAFNVFPALFDIFYRPDDGRQIIGCRFFCVNGQTQRKREKYGTESDGVFF